MDSILIRAATLVDITGICHVNRGEDGPWAEHESCLGSVKTRLENGFYIQVAEIDGQIVGHGEWIISDEYCGKTCYLGQLQVDPDWQYRGIGRKMVADGVSYARAHGCSRVTLIPNDETHSEIFYSKCSFVRGGDILSCALPSRQGAVQATYTAEAPHSVVKELPFTFGLTQTASEHMWQVFNRPAPWDTRMKNTLVGDGFCIQLGGFSFKNNALVMAWATPENAAEVIKVALAFAYELGYPGVNFYFRDEWKHLFPASDITSENYEMCLEL